MVAHLGVHKDMYENSVRGGEGHMEVGKLIHFIQVNVQSRVQMMLFKARRKARAKYEAALAETGLDEETFKKRVQGSRQLPVDDLPSVLHVGQMRGI